MKKLNIPSLSLIFFIGTLLLFGLPMAKAEEQEDNGSVTIIEPSKKVSKPTSATIEAGDFELGVYYGSLSVEDFATNPVQGISLNYHFTSKLSTQISYASSDVGRATFEDVVGGDFLSADDEEFNYIQVQAGYQVLHGRSFLGSKQRFNSYLYLYGGLESVQFARNDEIGFTFGSRYKLVVSENITLNIDLQDHFFEREFIADKKYTNNIEFSIGLNALF